MSLTCVVFARDEHQCTYDHDETHQKMLKVAATIDGDGDGRVDAEEIAKAYREVYGEECDPERARELLSQMDKDGDGHVTVEEFEYAALRGTEARARCKPFAHYPHERGFVSPLCPP